MFGATKRREDRLLMLLEQEFYNRGRTWVRNGRLRTREQVGAPSDSSLFYCTQVVLCTMKQAAQSQSFSALLTFCPQHRSQRKLMILTGDFDFWTVHDELVRVGYLRRGRLKAGYNWRCQGYMTPLGWSNSSSCLFPPLYLSLCLLSVYFLSSSRML